MKIYKYNFYYNKKKIYKIKKYLSKIINNYYKYKKNDIVTITNIKINFNNKNLKIFFIIIKRDIININNILFKLNLISNFLKFKLNKYLNFLKIFKINFKYDNLIIKTKKILDILKI